MNNLAKYENIIIIDGYVVDVKALYTCFDANVTQGERGVGDVSVQYGRQCHHQNLVKINGANGFRGINEVDQKIKDLQVLKKVYLTLVGYCDEVFYG